MHKLEECYQASDSARRQFEGEWVDNILFLEGRQWEKAAEDVRRGRKLPVRAPESRVQMTANWTYTLARQAVAGLRDNLAEQIAVPATADPADEAAAEVATDWLAFQYDQDGEDARRYHEILWAMVTGRSVRRSTWDPSRDGLGLVRGAKVTLPRAGDIASVSLNPWRFHVDPWSETFEEASYVIESDVRDVQEINDLYPGHTVAAEEVAVGLGMVQGLANASLRGGGGYAQRRKEAAVLKRMYCRPTTKYPRGRVYTWANGKLLQTSDLPEGEMPFVALDWFYIPGRLVPLAFITPIRDPQREYNITLSQLVELKNRQLRGDLVIQGAVNEDDVTQDVDPVTGWKRTRLAPHVQSYELMQYNLNPSTAEMLLARFWEDGQQAAGVRDPSLGSAGRGDAGKTLGGLMLLRESDTQGLSLFRVGFDRAYSAIARQKLLLARNHYKVPRMVRVVGLSDAPKVRAFLGSDLRNTEDIKARPARDGDGDAEGADPPATRRHGSVRTLPGTGAQARDDDGAAELGAAVREGGGGPHLRADEL